MFVPAPQLTSTGGKIEFFLLHFSPRHCLGQYTEYLDVEGDPVVIYEEFENGKDKFIPFLSFLYRLFYLAVQGSQWLRTNSFAPKLFLSISFDAKSQANIILRL